jgi:glucose-1-phosphate thymidylyltransferase
MKGVILAAGKGTRLYPVTRHIAKPLLPIANRMTLEYAFDRLKEIGARDVCVVAGENEHQLRRALGDGSAFGVNLAYAVQDEPMGLAHAVACAQAWTGGEPFVLYLGDAIYSGGFQEHAERFLQTRCANLNIVRWVEDPRRFGVATLEGERIVRLVEKPANPESNWAMAGLYFFGPEIWDVLPELRPSRRGEYEITEAIQMLIDRGHDVRAGAIEHHWFDTGTLDSFLDASRHLSHGGQLHGPGASLTGEAGHHVVLGAASHTRCARIEDSVVLPGATVEAAGTIRGCLVGGNVRREGDLDGEILYGA